MKKFLSVFCPIVACELSVALMFKILRLPSGNVQLLIAMVMAIIASICVLVYLLRKPEHKLAKFVTAIATICLLLGVVFKLFHWPGTGILLLVSLGLLIPVAAILCGIAFAKGK